MIGEPFLTVSVSLIVVSILVSVFIYGVVLIIIKLDDLGLAILAKNETGTFIVIGNSLVKGSPYIMKFLGIFGTVAMFLVGGGIVNHTFHLLASMNEHLAGLISGLVVGLLALLCVNGIKVILNKRK